MSVKNIKSKIIFDIKISCKLSSFNSIKLRPIKVKNVINAIERVIKNIIIINKFLFNKENIN